MYVQNACSTTRNPIPMATTFASLPIIDVAALKDHPPQQLPDLSQRLYQVFTTTGFAYLVNPPLSFPHEEVFAMARDFFSLPLEDKMKLAKQSFRPQNPNAYRGYSIPPIQRAGPHSRLMVSDTSQPNPSTTPITSKKASRSGPHPQHPPRPPPQLPKSPSPNPTSGPAIPSPPDPP